MLRDKNRMTAPRRLPPVVRWLGRRETLRDQVTGVRHDRSEAFRMQVINITSAESLPPAEVRLRERLENIPERPHSPRLYMQNAGPLAQSRVRKFSPQRAATSSP